MLTASTTRWQFIAYDLWFINSVNYTTRTCKSQDRSEGFIYDKSQLVPKNRILEAAELLFLTLNDFIQDQNSNIQHHKEKNNQNVGQHLCGRVAREFSKQIEDTHRQKNTRKGKNAECNIFFAYLPFHTITLLYQIQVYRLVVLYHNFYQK